MGREGSSGRCWVVLGTVLALVGGVASSAAAGIVIDANTGGISTWGHKELARAGHEQKVAMKARKPYYVYKTVLACGASGSMYKDDGCVTASTRTFCPDEDGPLVDIYRQLRKADGTPAPPPDGQWQPWGQTCLPNEVPGADKVPSMVMIRESFHKTPWATASMGFQPAKNRTLVNLTNYYQAKWSTSGFEPGEIDSIDPGLMFGHRVEIRPRLAAFVYHYGDGTASKRTKSTGGTYRSHGDITHAYTKTGTYQAYVSVTWSADFRIDGGSWLDIGDTVTVDQPATTITVLRSRARLLPN